MNNESSEDKRLYLKMIEDIITRMGNNSFLIKGWSMTAVGGIVTLYFSKRNFSDSYYLLVVALFVSLLFWINDAYFLQIELRFRKLYDLAVQGKKDYFDMNPPKIGESFIQTMMRPVFLLSYGIISIILLILIYLFK